MSASGLASLLTLANVGMTPVALECWDYSKDPRKPVFRTILTNLDRTKEVDVTDLAPDFRFSQWLSMTEFIYESSRDHSPRSYYRPHYIHNLATGNSRPLKLKNKTIVCGSSFERIDDVPLDRILMGKTSRTYWGIFDGLQSAVLNFKEDFERSYYSEHAVIVDDRKHRRHFLLRGGNDWEIESVRPDRVWVRTEIDNPSRLITSIYELDMIEGNAKAVVDQQPGYVRFDVDSRFWVLYKSQLNRNLERAVGKPVVGDRITGEKWQLGSPLFSVSQVYVYGCFQDTFFEACVE